MRFCWAEKARKAVVVAYQKRKQDEVQHPVLDQKMPLGLVAHTRPGCWPATSAATWRPTPRSSIDRETAMDSMDFLVTYDVITEDAAGPSPPAPCGHGLPELWRSGYRNRFSSVRLAKSSTRR